MSLNTTHSCNIHSNRILLDKISAAKSIYSTVDFDKRQEDLRENQLDAMFLVRKQKLEQISKQNKLIFEKIYTQKSKYAKQNLLAQYNEQKQISSRMSKLKAKLREQQSQSRDKSFVSKRCVRVDSSKMLNFDTSCSTIKKIDNPNIRQYKQMLQKLPSLRYTNIPNLNYRKVLAEIDNKTMAVKNSLNTKLQDVMLW